MHHLSKRRASRGASWTPQAREARIKISYRGITGNPLGERTEWPGPYSQVVASARGRQESHDRPVRHPDDRPAVVTAFISLAVAAPVTYLIMAMVMVSMHRRCGWMATAASALAPIGNEWWSGGGQVQRPVSPADQRIVATAVAAGSNHPWLGQLVLIAVAFAAVGAFTVLQLRAWSRRRRSPSGRSRGIYDWRTLPPPRHEDDPGPSEMPFGQQESYGPLWRYGAPRGYGRDYEPGREPARGPGYGRDSDAGPGDSPGPGPDYGPSSGPGPGSGFVPGHGHDFGPDSGSGPGHGPDYGAGIGYGSGLDPGARRSWRVPGDEPHDWKP
jgi:hypothetical protein